MARPRDTTPIEDLKILTIPKALALLRLIGRPTSRARLGRAIQTGRLQAQIDYDRVDRCGQPLLRIYRKDLDRWLASALRPLQIPA